MNKQIEIKENKSGNGLGSARFLIPYNKGNPNKELKKKSYTIISALKGNLTIYIELNSSLLSVIHNQRGELALNFLKQVKAMNLNYRYRKLAQASKPTGLLALLNFAGKGDDVHEIYVEIPHSVWRDDSFQELLPVYGVKYYITNGNQKTSDLLDNLFNGQLLDEEILETFQMVVFDCPHLGQMAIYTDSLTFSDLQGLLNSDV